MRGLAPLFRTFARNKYNKEIEQLTPGGRASFGHDFSGYLVDAKKEAADFQKIYQQIKKDRSVSAERKALFDKIELARNNFDYKEVVLAIREKQLGPDHPNTQAVTNNLNDLIDKMKKP